MSNDTSEVRKLLQLFEQSDFTAMRIELAGLSLSVAKNGAELIGSRAATQAVELRSRIAPDQPTVPKEQVEAPPVIKAAAEPSSAHEGDLIVRSPMLGTFYRAPSPQDPAYVEVGDTVRKGQILCLIECMKLFNTIEAEADGEVATIEAANGDMVEFGQPLIRIRKA